MADPLTAQFGAEIPLAIGDMIARAHPAFDPQAFVADALDGYDALGLMARGRRIAHALRRHLPVDYDTAVQLLMHSLGPKLERTECFGMASFLYLPHTLFVAEYGLDAFETSMRAQYELTQRFSAEFSIRPYLERYPERTLARLLSWAGDASPHVRRLVSEGTRPRLPWAPRLRQFQHDPRPVLALLELLKDDRELYVRRSVANNLNDIGKDHPALLAETARRWMVDATDERQWVIRHGLRSAVKRGEADAISLLGGSEGASVAIADTVIRPQTVVLGDALTIAFDVVNTGSRTQRLLVDLKLHFVKANGQTRPKVFKLKVVELRAREHVRLGKTISLADKSTRKHHPGVHRMEALVNGRAHALGAFELTATG